MELMIAVAIVGVLTTLAMFAYNKYIKGARSANEVPAVLSEFQLREQQYAVEHNGFFLSTGANEADKWPPAPSGSKMPTAIAGGPTSCTGSPAGTWCQLHISLDKTELFCAYVAIAGAANDASTIGADASGTFGMAPAPTQNWYYVLAECDWDDDNALNEKWFVRSDIAGRQRVNPKK